MERFHRVCQFSSKGAFMNESEVADARVHTYLSNLEALLRRTDKELSREFIREISASIAQHRASESGDPLEAVRTILTKLGSENSLAAQMIAIDIDNRRKLGAPMRTAKYLRRNWSWLLFALFVVVTVSVFTWAANYQPEFSNSGPGGVSVTNANGAPAKNINDHYANFTTFFPTTKIWKAKLIASIGVFGSQGIHIDYVGLHPQSPWLDDTKEYGLPYHYTYLLNPYTGKEDGLFNGSSVPGNGLVETTIHITDQCGTSPSALIYSNFWVVYDFHGFHHVVEIPLNQQFAISCNGY